MATQTPNFNFDLRESSDIFNPLSSNANFESLDTILKNLQENGGITTYTTTAAANLLKLSGTPKVNDTVFKFVAAGDANTWTAATGGVVNNIVALDGKQVTIKGGNMYVAWVNSANAMVVVAWPAVVDAQTFDGKGPTEWASKAQLEAVNQTAANATQTAQAAATVANNAMDVAKSAGFNIERLWSQNPTTMRTGREITLSKPITDYKMYVIVFQGLIDQPANNTVNFEIGLVSERVKPSMNIIGYSSMKAVYTYGGSLHTAIRAYFFDDNNAKAMTFLSTSDDDSCIPTAVYGIK